MFYRNQYHVIIINLSAFNDMFPMVRVKYEMDMIRQMSSESIPLNLSRKKLLYLKKSKSNALCKSSFQPS